MKKTVSILSKRNSQIITDIYDAGSGSGLLIMAHSFKSERDEDGRYEKLAEKLIDDHISSIALDFPGNGDSTESMKEYSLDNCLDDLDSVYDYALKYIHPDTSRMALLGYSMGGRIISLFLNRHREFKTLLFWAACNRNYSLDDVFLEQPFKQMKEEADEKGYFSFHDIFSGSDDIMPKQFVDNMLQYDALKPLNDFKGSALIIQGDRDTTIEVDNGKLIYEALSKCTNKELFIMKGADHGFGLWNNREEDNKILLNLSYAFLRQNV